MAVDPWIKVRVGLRRHPKVVRISSSLKSDRLRVVGGLHAVWSVFDEHSVDGCLPGYSFEAMDEEIGWPGFAQAMQDVGWLVQDVGRGLVMPRFETHNGSSAKRRAQDSERKRESRKGGRELSADDADNLSSLSNSQQPKGEVSRERGERLDREWTLPADWKAWALKEQPTWDEPRVDNVALNFRDYWTSKSGKEATKVDWGRAWRRWVRNEWATSRASATRTTDTQWLQRAQELGVPSRGLSRDELIARIRDREARGH